MTIGQPGANWGSSAVWGKKSPEAVFRKPVPRRNNHLHGPAGELDDRDLGGGAFVGGALVGGVVVGGALVDGGLGGGNGQEYGPGKLSPGV